METIKNDDSRCSKSEKSLVNIRSSLSSQKSSMIPEKKATEKITKNSSNFLNEEIPTSKEEIKKNNLVNDVKNDYLKIDSKNIFAVNNNELSKKKLNEKLKENDEIMEENKQYLSTITENFLDKLFPGCNRNIFTISQTISRKLIKSRKINIALIEEKINNYFSKLFKLRCEKKLTLDLENIVNIGYIICYCYSKFNEYKINSLGILLDKTKEVIISKIDVLTDFYDYCYKKDIIPDECKKTEAWEKMKNKYVLPSELIFLMNSFSSINILNIDSNFINTNSSDNDDNYYFFILILLNINLIFNKLSHFEINLINKKLQYKIYMEYYKRLISFYKNLKNDLKVNKIYYQDDIYENKWDFKGEFLLEEYRRNISEEKIKNYKVDDDSIKESFVILYGDEFNFRIIDDPLITTSKIKETNKNESFIYDQKNFEKLEKNEIKNRLMSFSGQNMLLEEYKLTTNINNKIRNKNIKVLLDTESEKIIEIVIFIIIRITLFKKLKNIDLILSDCYYLEIDYLFKKYFDIDPSTNVDFHILDRFIQRTLKLEILNIEVNILDCLTFSKVIYMIDKNKFLKTLQISFFTSDIIYFQSMIYKMYLLIKDEIEMKTNDIKEGEQLILNELLPFFVENLEVLFELFKSRNFEILGLNFDIPEIIEQEERYLTVILKFVLNILFLINNPFLELKKLTLLSPKTKLDSRFSPNIEHILDKIDINTKNKNLNELNLQLKFINIKNIKNLLSSNLIKLSIGDCDVITFKELTKHLTSYKFCKYSVLRILSISIIKSITKYNEEIKLSLIKIFSIKIKTLGELNIYSNIFIKEIEQYKKLIELINYNWIPNCKLIINKECLSYNIYLEKLFYLEQCKLKENLSQPDESDRDQKFELDDTDKNDEIYWYLKYLLNNVYKIGNNFEKKKKAIFNILKYLYLMKEVNFSYK